MAEKVVSDVIINYKSVGLDKVGQEIKQTSVALDGLVVASTSAEKATASLENRFKGLERGFSTAEGNAAKFAKVQDSVNKAVAQNPALMERGNEVLAKAAERYGQVSLATGKAAASGKLANHELINASRQFQDIAVSLQGGQGFGTVMLQQGSQLVDIAITTGATFAGVKAQIGGFATAVAAAVSPTMATVGALGSLGTVAVAAGMHWASAQKDIENALKGIGRQSGVTAVDINQIALATSQMTASSIGEAREFATAFARMGVTGKQNIALATQAVDGLAKSMGVDASEAAKTLGNALVDPAQGVDTLEKSTGAYDQETQALIKTLVQQGEVEKARTVMLQATIKGTRDAAEANGLWAASFKYVKDGFNLIGQDVRMAKQVGGYLSGLGDVPTEGLTRQDQLRLAQQDLASFQQVLPQRLAFASQRGADSQPVAAEYAKLADLLDQVNRLTKSLADDGLAGLKLELNDNATATAKMATQTQNFVSALGDAATAAEKEQARIEALTVAYQRNAFGAQGSAEAQEKYARALNANPAVIAAEKTTKSMAQQNEVLRAGIGLQGEAQQIAQARVQNEQLYQKLLKDNVDEETARNQVMEQAKNQALKMTEAQEQSQVNVHAIREEMWMVAEQTGRAAYEAARYADEMQDGAAAAHDAANAANQLAAQMAAARAAAGGSDDFAFGPAADRRAFGSSTSGKLYESTGGNPAYNAMLLTRAREQRAAEAAGIPGTYGADPGEAAAAAKMGYDLYAILGEQRTVKAEELTESIDKLTSSTDALNRTNSELLSPYYTQDPRTSHIGFRSQGMASGGYVDVPGAPSSNDNMIATIPVASGERIYVDPMGSRRGGSSSRPIAVTQNIMISGGANRDEVKRTMFQAGQQLAKQVAAAR